MRPSLIIGSLLTLPFSIFAAPISSQIPDGEILRSRDAMKPGGWSIQELHELPPPPGSKRPRPEPKPLPRPPPKTPYTPHSGPPAKLPLPGTRPKDLNSRMMPGTWTMMKGTEAHPAGVPIWKKPLGEPPSPVKGSKPPRADSPPVKEPLSPENPAAQPDKSSKRDLISRMPQTWTMMGETKVHPAGVPIWKKPTEIEPPAPAADAVKDSKPAIDHGPDWPATLAEDSPVNQAPESAINLNENKLLPNDPAAQPEAAQPEAAQAALPPQERDLISREWRLKDSPQPRPVLDHAPPALPVPQYRGLVRRVKGMEWLTGGKTPAKPLYDPSIPAAGPWPKPLSQPGADPITLDHGPSDARKYRGVNRGPLDPVKIPPAPGFNGVVSPKMLDRRPLPDRLFKTGPKVPELSSP